jgi:hypothetical protein
MGVAKGVEEGGGWPYGHLAFQRCTGAEGGEYSRPLAAGVLASRLKEAARAASGGSREAAHHHSLPRDRRKREACGRLANVRPPELQRTPSSFFGSSGPPDRWAGGGRTWSIPSELICFPARSDKMTL